MSTIFWGKAYPLLTMIPSHTVNGVPSNYQFTEADNLEALEVGFVPVNASDFESQDDAAHYSDRFSGWRLMATLQLSQEANAPLMEFLRRMMMYTGEIRLTPHVDGMAEVLPDGSHKTYWVVIPKRDTDWQYITGQRAVSFTGMAPKITLMGTERRTKLPENIYDDGQIGTSNSFDANKQTMWLTT
jgi:hypothetical protein